MKESAIEHYKARRGNCAQAVALAWRDKKQPDSDHYSRFSGFGGGQAPDGLCGALHAACELAGADLKETLQARFSQLASGHTTCLEIRRNRVMTCAECVAIAAGLLEELHGEKK
jgi:hypothetical protein